MGSFWLMLTSILFTIRIILEDWWFADVHCVRCVQQKLLGCCSL